MKAENQTKILAQAIYDIRQLLSGYLGSQNPADISVRKAAHLAYALHNEALSVMEGGTFDIDLAISKIKAAEKIFEARSTEKKIVVSGAFDDIRARDLRFLEEAAKLGELTVLLWPDAAIQKLTGKTPKFPFVERNYFLNAVRYVSRVMEADASADFNSLPKDLCANIWADVEAATNSAREKFARENKISYHVFVANELKDFPEPAVLPSTSGRKKVIVTGSYDWFHSGHVRFLEEVSGYGDLYVVVGHDANIRLLKGEGHPLIPENERRYVVGSIKFLKQALISTGDGWLDADPEIKKIKPDIYAVNEDGDKGGKREYCGQNGIEYLVLKRTPAPGLPKRSSTDLRGF